MIAHNNGPGRACPTPTSVVVNACTGRARSAHSGIVGFLHRLLSKVPFVTIQIAAAADMQTILVIDDDESLRATIGVLLEQEGFRAVLIEDGREGFEKALLLKPDLILVDLRLPGMGGVDICKQLRAAQAQTPIIVLSAAGDEVDKVLLLEIGADDYVVKPFGSRELLARIRALLRRTSPDAHIVFHFADAEIDLDRRLVSRRGEDLKLTPAEYNLLTYFLQNPDRPLTPDMILNSVWGYQSFPNTRTVDAHVVKLRQKLEPDPNMPRHFLTVHGVGYRFVP